MSEYVGYIPVPVWDGKQWRPMNFCVPSTGFDGHEEMQWPDGFDPATIPPPRHNLHEWISFNWDSGVRRGEILRIKRSGGAYREWDGGPLKVAQERYFQPPTYEVDWNAHRRYVEERNIVAG